MRRIWANEADPLPVHAWAARLTGAFFEPQAADKPVLPRLFVGNLYSSTARAYTRIAQAIDLLYKKEVGMSIASKTEDLKILVP
jgi:hypothetical protein